MRLIKVLTYSFLILVSGSMIFSCQSKSNSQTKSSLLKDTIKGYIPPVPGAVSDDEKKRLSDAIATFYDKMMKRSGINGALLVAKKGNIIFEQYHGYYDILKKDSLIKENTAFHLASLSKTFTAMAILKLSETGKLKLTDDVKKYIPTLPYDGINIFMLLTHRSALPNYVYFMEELGWDTHQYITNQDIVDYMAKYQPPLWGKPNTHFRYCNTNYALLATIIEKASGESYPDYLNEVFFKPLGMKDSYVFTLADTLTAMPSFNLRGRRERLWYLDGGYGDKNVYSTPRDLLKWDQALYSGELFKQSTLDSAFAPYSNEKKGVKNYGLGWRMNVYPNGKKIIFHTGWWHGNNTILIRLISDSATIIALGNKYNRSVYMSKDLANIFEFYFKTDERETENGDSEHGRYKRKHAVKHAMSRKRRKK